MDDLIEGLLRVMTTEKGFTGPINLDNPNEFTMLELAKSVLQLVKIGRSLRFKPFPADDPKQRKLNFDLAIAKLGRKPTVKLNEGLKTTIKYFGGLVGDNK